MGSHSKPFMVRCCIGNLVQTYEYYYREHAQRIYNRSLLNGYKVEFVSMDRLLPEGGAAS